MRAPSSRCCWVMRCCSTACMKVRWWVSINLSINWWSCNQCDCGDLRTRTMGLISVVRVNRSWCTRTSGFVWALHWRKDMNLDDAVTKIHLCERQDGGGRQSLWTAWLVWSFLGLFPECKTAPLTEYGCMTSYKATTSVRFADHATNLFIFGKEFRQFHNAQEDVSFSCYLTPEGMGSNG